MKKEQAFKLSRSNRKESDKLEKEANDILLEIEKLEPENWTNKHNLYTSEKTITC